MSNQTRTKIRALFLVAAVSCIAAGFMVTAHAQPDSPTGETVATYKPVQPIGKMMDGQNKLYKEIRAGILDKDWKEASLSAWILAEVANANQYQHENPEYRQIAAKMSEQCVELARMLQNKDEKAAMSQVTAIGQSCQACHDKFKK